MKEDIKKYDIITALFFIMLTIIFLILIFKNKKFFDWTFERHQNQISWYIRPLFIIPLCYFSFKKSFSGIFMTMFLLLTSMFWFPKPDIVNNQVSSFLQFEKEYLLGKWDLVKILFTLLIPLSLGMLCTAFWRKNVGFGMVVVITIALMKILWSIMYGGEAGKSIIVPSITGLIICMVIIVIYFKYRA